MSAKSDTSSGGERQVKTIREVLREAYPEHMTRIEELTNVPGNFDRDAKDDPAGYHLAGMFSWATTEEGHVFWCGLARQHGWEC